MNDRQNLRRVLLYTLLGFIVLLYLLGAASLWARQRFLDDRAIHRPFLIERIAATFPDAF